MQTVLQEGGGTEGNGDWQRTTQLWSCEIGLKIFQSIVSDLSDKHARSGSETGSETCIASLQSTCNIIQERYVKNRRPSVCSLKTVHTAAKQILSSVLAIPSGNVSEYRTAAPPEIDLTGDSLSPPISTHHDLVEIQRSPLSVSSDRDLTDKTVQLPGQTAIREIAQESFQTKSANEEKQAKTVSPIIHPSSKYHQAPQVASLSARRDGRSLSQSHPKPAEQRSPGLNEVMTSLWTSLGHIDQAWHVFSIFLW